MVHEPSVELKQLSKQFGPVQAVREASLSIARGEFFALLGPSGCGKTTLLRLIAGLELPTAGQIRIDGQSMTRVPAHRRPGNTVFQHYALFPHLNVLDNVAFGLRYQGVPRKQYRARAAEALALVQLAGYESRRPGQLSGGQRQRVALARALVLRPRVLLLDEPLAALDQNLRQQMQGELKHLQRTVGITFIFVTHDQEEAMAMSDRIAVMNAGLVEQVGAAAEVFEQPATPFVARFMGADNILPATVLDTGGGEATVRLAGGAALRLPARGQSLNRGQDVLLAVRPEKLSLHPAPPPEGSDEICLPVRIVDRLYKGIGTLWTAEADDGQRFSVYQQNSRQTSNGQALNVGDRAWVYWSAGDAVLLSQASHGQEIPAKPPKFSPESASHGGAWGPFRGRGRATSGGGHER
jgi:spermidine/putrescine ABC transporter ATP-binding subunit